MSTRTIERSDGGLEILRLLNDGALGRWTKNDPLSFEKGIVWLQPLESLDFVRVALIDNARSRRGPIVCPNVIVLGYSKLTPDAPRNPETGAYTRRLFYLKPQDAQLNMNEVPQGAVDPRTVLPGETGSPPKLAAFDRAYPWYLRKSQQTPAVASAARSAVA